VLHADALDRPVGQVAVQDVGRIVVRRLDGVVVLEERRMPLVRVAADEA
jgi:hypothetical protein